MGGRRHETGRLGELLAASYLERKGYRVVARNYRCRLGEVDLIASGPGRVALRRGAHASTAPLW